MPEPRVVITKEAEGGAIGGGLAVIQGTATRQAKLPAAANARAVGITGFAADAAGNQMAVVVLGQAKAVASAAISAGAAVDTAGTTGKLRTAPTPGAGVNANIIGYALSAAAADGDKFDLLVVPSTIRG